MLTIMMLQTAAMVMAMAGLPQAPTALKALEVLRPHMVILPQQNK
jgi:hypothetical protein